MILLSGDAQNYIKCQTPSVWDIDEYKCLIMLAKKEDCQHFSIFHLHTSCLQSFSLWNSISIGTGDIYINKDLYILRHRYHPTINHTEKNENPIRHPNKRTKKDPDSYRLRKSETYSSLKCFDSLQIEFPACEIVFSAGRGCGFVVDH